MKKWRKTLASQEERIFRNNFHPFDTQSNHLTLIELVSSVASEKELEIRSDIALQQPNEAKPILSLCISTLR